MNAIALKLIIDSSNDLTRNARFQFLDYNNAVNLAIQQFIDKKMGDDANSNPQNFQWTQGIRDDLYTLLKENSPTLTPGSAITTSYGSFLPTTFPMPTDYYDFVCLNAVINGKTYYVRPTTYNMLGPLMNDSFRMPTNIMPYYIENKNGSSPGYTIWRGTTGTMSSATLEYIKTPATYNVGQESQLINAGTGVLTNAAVYIATENSVQDSVSYPIGTQFTAVGTTLTSGQVILASNTTACDLPDRVQDSIAQMASVILLKNIQMYDSAQAVDSQVSKP